MLADQRAFAGRIRGVDKRRRRGERIDRSLTSLRGDMLASAARRERRLISLPVPSFPEQLPVAERRVKIEQAIAAHQVIIVAGETGSGKTTQLPKICLQLGRGVAGMIGCTQPRRIAARSVARRVADELEVKLGGIVGYQTRFSDRCSADTLVKFMTDGILLAETQSDALFSHYDTLIIDEAHERSLNIDFLLGHLKQVLPRRPDLKVIVTSATIDTERFAAHFDGAPVVSVAGRTYPVEVRYKPLSIDDGASEERDLYGGITAAVAELGREDPRGDILVFVSGEREIRESVEVLKRQHFRHTEILPLYARLGAKEQSRIFSPGNLRRIIVSTNVAETSLTLPRIRFVIDSGRARISRYSHRGKVQRLPIEPISQASANQRTGRCGRLGPGICVRLYAEDDFAGRPEFTQPEILRTSLAAVILKMRAFGLGEVETFPFLEPPADKMISDGYQVLQELGALDSEHHMTDIGSRLARLPLDVRLGRMLLAAEPSGCVSEVLTLAAVLSIPDPRERPMEAREKADQAHSSFNQPGSDFLAYLKLWGWYEEQRKKLSNNQLRKIVRGHYLSYMRLLEWRDLRRQLQMAASEQGMSINQQPADYESIHRALLSGLLNHLGYKEERSEYMGARGRRFLLFPGSSIYKKGPPWVMAAELVETSRVYARVCARIEPQWIEAAATHLVRRHHFDPHWSKRSGKVMASEQVTLFGLPIVQDRPVHYGPIDAVVSRQIFIRDGLAEDQLRGDARFQVKNRALITDVEELEKKQRRRDLLLETSEIADFFERIVPPEITTQRAFDRWRKRVEVAEPDLLVMTQQDLMRRRATGVDEARFPDGMVVGGVQLSLSYHFEPGELSDGVTLHVPLQWLNAIEPECLEWLVPGLLREKVTALIKGLPKSLRRNFVPAPEYVQLVLETVVFGEGSLRELVALQLQRAGGQALLGAVNSVDLPAHLLMNIRVEDDNGRQIIQGRDLALLQGELAGAADRSLAASAGGEYTRDEITSWDFGELPRSVAVESGGHIYPALTEVEDGVGMRPYASREEADQAHAGALCRLVELNLGTKLDYARRHLPISQQMCMHYSVVDSCHALKEDLLFNLIAYLVSTHGTDVRNREVFESLVKQVDRDLLREANRLVGDLGRALPLFQRIRAELTKTRVQRWPEAVEDMQSQLDNLIYPGFLRDLDGGRLKHYSRYLRGIEQRLQRLSNSPARDAQRQLEITPWWRKYLDYWEETGEYTPAFENLRWLLEEYRVSLFAQELKTAMPVSGKRVERAWSELQG